LTFHAWASRSTATEIRLSGLLGHSPGLAIGLVLASSRLRLVGWCARHAMLKMWPRSNAWPSMAMSLLAAVRFAITRMEIHLWSAASGTLSAVLRNGDARQPITRALALSGGVLVSGDDDAVRLWSITELNVQASWRHPGHKAVTVAICTGADGSTGAISGSITDKSARVWAPNDASAVHVLKHPEWVWTVATEGDVIVTGSHGPIVRLWSLGSGTLIRELNKEPGAGPGAGPGLTSDVCLRQGLLVAASADRIVRVWTLDAEHNATGPRKLVGHEGHINGLAISSSGQIVSCGQRSETAPARPRIIVWEPRGCPAL